MEFNNQTFLQAMQDNTEGLKLSSGWQPWQGVTGGNNEVVEYTYNNQNYRTWNQESSQTNVMGSPMNLGIMVSCKIDYERPSPNQDDHIIILAGFMLDNNVPKLCIAQALVEFTTDETYNMNTGPITSGDITQGIYDAINAKITTVPHGDSSSEGREYFPFIAQINIDSIVASVS